LATADPVLDHITILVDRFIVVKCRGGFDRQKAQPVARLRPLLQTDGFELIYWSAHHDHWRTFGPPRSGPTEP